MSRRVLLLTALLAVVSLCGWLTASGQLAKSFAQEKKPGSGGIATLSVNYKADEPATKPGAKKPNIVVIMGDDIGMNNVSAYGRGVVGYRTQNIARLAKEGAMFTDWYGQQSCTAGRAAFIMGQSQAGHQSG